MCRKYAVRHDLTNRCNGGIASTTCDAKALAAAELNRYAASSRQGRNRRLLY